MVKTLNIALEDADWERLNKAKGEKSWRDFIMQLAPAKKGQEGLGPDDLFRVEADPKQ